MAQKEISLFGLYDLSVKYPTDPSGQWVKINYVNDASYKGSVSTVDQLGDDARQNVFLHTQKGTVTVKAEQVVTAVFEKITGTVVRSGATTNPLAVSGQAEILDFQTLAELTPPYVSLRATINGTRPDGTRGTCTAYWYKCNVQTAYESFPSPAYGKIDEVTLTFEAFISSNDENNSALTVPCFGRIEIF
jgi:hypothetical protein